MNFMDEVLLLFQLHSTAVFIANTIHVTRNTLPKISNFKFDSKLAKLVWKNVGYFAQH